jgi:hypothetical protein
VWVVEEDRPRLRQVERPVAVREVRRDDAAEGEAEVARLAELGLHPPGVRPQVRKGTADAVRGRGQAGLDVERAGTGHRDVGLPAWVDDDAAPSHRMANEHVHLVVAGVLVVAVHDDRERRLGRPGPDRLEHVPRVGAAPTRAHAPTAMGVVAASRSRLRLRGLRGRCGGLRHAENGGQGQGRGQSRDCSHSVYMRRSRRGVRPSRRIISVNAMASARTPGG